MTDHDVYFKARVVDPMAVGTHYPPKGAVVTIIREANTGDCLHWRPKEYPAITWWYSHCFERLGFKNYYEQIYETRRMA